MCLPITTTSSSRSRLVSRLLLGRPLGIGTSSFWRACCGAGGPASRLSTCGTLCARCWGSIIVIAAITLPAACPVIIISSRSWLHPCSRSRVGSCHHLSTKHGPHHEPHVLQGTSMHACACTRQERAQLQVWWASGAVGADSIASRHSCMRTAQATSTQHHTTLRGWHVLRVGSALRVAAGHTCRMLLIAPCQTRLLQWVLITDCLSPMR